jgi:hypothetical protein
LSPLLRFRAVLSFINSIFFILLNDFLASILAFDALQPTVDEISDGLIAGNDAGLTDFLTFVTDQTTGLIGAALPAPIKAILDVVKPILNIIKNCPK